MHSRKRTITSTDNTIHIPQTIIVRTAFARLTSTSRPANKAFTMARSPRLHTWYSALSPSACVQEQQLDQHATPYITHTTIHPIKHVRATSHDNVPPWHSHWHRWTVAMPRSCRGSPLQPPSMACNPSADNHNTKTQICRSKYNYK